MAFLVAYAAYAVVLWAVFLLAVGLLAIGGRILERRRGRRNRVRDYRQPGSGRTAGQWMMGGDRPLTK